MTALPTWTDLPAYFPDPQHRIWLRRRLSGSGPPVAFILHNPSTASAETEDPTSRRGISFANTMNASDMIFVNAATGIATDADNLATLADPIGSMADEALQVATQFVTERAGVIIAAWGAPKGKAATRRLMATRFAAIERLGLTLHALRVTATGHPEHPLYLPGSLRPVLWRLAPPPY